MSKEESIRMFLGVGARPWPEFFVFLRQWGDHPSKTCHTRWEIIRERGTRTFFVSVEMLFLRASHVMFLRERERSVKRAEINSGKTELPDTSKKGEREETVQKVECSGPRPSCSSTVHFETLLFETRVLAYTVCEKVTVNRWCSVSQQKIDSSYFKNGNAQTQTCRE